VTLRVTEAKYVSRSECTQELPFEMRVVESVELKVKKPMELEIDNKGSIDLMTNWLASGQTKHIDTRHYFL